MRVVVVVVRVAREVCSRKGNPDQNEEWTWEHEWIRKVIISFSLELVMSTDAEIIRDKIEEGPSRRKSRCLRIV